MGTGGQRSKAGAAATVGASVVVTLVLLEAALRVITRSGTLRGFPLCPIDPAAPVLSITKTHTGNFTQGQTNATYTVTVSNTGNAPTSGTITVTETVPSGLTLVSMAGTGDDLSGTSPSACAPRPARKRPSPPSCGRPGSSADAA